MKTIAIIGGMGPQASVHAHKILNQTLIINNKRANIVHVSLSVDHFFGASTNFKLSQEFKELLWPYQG